jgi:enamine deaminase RidA (YjgF/YER057c/UK114 family)
MAGEDRQDSGRRGLSAPGTVTAKPAPAPASPFSGENRMSIDRIGTTPRYSDAVAHGGTVYLVEVPQTLDADIATQTREVLAAIERLLLRAGSDKSRLLMVTIYLRDMADYATMNAIWDTWLPEGTAPARACVQAVLANPDFAVEMAVVAAR